jgi:glucans biosynthesis protein
MLGKDQRYGASARGLAINSGESGVKEEFPIFTEWWLGKPDKDVNTLRLYGLLDSVSCAGAYDFLLKPGDPTVADVNAVLFTRAGNGRSLKTLGLAPITSMFWFGENSEAKPDDYRVEVHDSDGLLIRGENDELTWRPLSNPGALRRQVFPAKDVRAFGLLQRDRDFSHYEDLFNLYHKTPSVWIEPRGNWGEGELHLVEIPTNFEGADNIVVFWNPTQKPVPMQPYRFGYTMHWALEPDDKLPPLRVVQTRIGAHAHDSKKRQVMIDFAPKGGELSAETPHVEASCGESGVVTDVQVAKNELSKTWRVIFSLTPKAETNVIVDIQCALKAGDKPVSETWKYQWTPLSKNK